MDLTSVIFVWHHNPEVTVKHNQWHKHIQCRFLNALFQTQKTLQPSSYPSYLAAYCKVPSDSLSMLLLAFRLLLVTFSDYLFQIFLHPLLNWSELSVAFSSLVKSGSLVKPGYTHRNKDTSFFFLTEWLRNKNDSRNKAGGCSLTHHISRGTSVNLTFLESINTPLPCHTSLFWGLPVPGTADQGTCSPLPKAAIPALQMMCCGT